MEIGNYRVAYRMMSGFSSISHGKFGSCLEVGCSVFEVVS